MVSEMCEHKLQRKITAQSIQSEYPLMQAAYSLCP